MSYLHASQFMPEVLSKYTGKSIQTEYQGILFRSRAEARWAVFLNALGVRWEYEREGYDLNGIRYLPDFWLPELGCWYEIKGDDPNDLDCEKSHRLARHTGKPCFITFNEITLPHSDQGPPRCHAFFPQNDGRCGYADIDYVWCECLDCGKFGIEYMGYSNRMPCKARHNAPGCERIGKNDKGSTCGTPRLIAAYNAARRERFGT
jgi:hypothetical protein